MKKGAKEVQDREKATNQLDATPKRVLFRHNTVVHAMKNSAGGLGSPMEQGTGGDLETKQVDVKRFVFEKAKEQSSADQVECN